jgi:hypothetical protein
MVIKLVYRSKRARGFSLALSLLIEYKCSCVINQPVRMIVNSLSMVAFRAGNKDVLSIQTVDQPMHIRYPSAL